MGQVRALLYKQWILTKRQKVGLVCELLTPLFSLILIWSSIYIVRHQKIDLGLENNNQSDDGVLPTYFHVGYLSNPSTQNVPISKDHLDNWNYRRILRYWASDQCRAEVGLMIDQKIKYSEFVDKNGQWSPRFELDKSLTNPAHSNQELIRELKEANTIEEEGLEDFEGLADAVVLFNSSQAHGGMNIHMQMNTLIRSNYHRSNGISKLRFKILKDSKYYKTDVTPTEGYISTMSYLNNKFLTRFNIFELDKPNIAGAVSLTADSTAIMGYIESGISTMSIVFFPVALTLGFPLLLYALVLEKEQKVTVLLEVSGLSYTKYWLSIYILYFILFTITSTMFSVLGWIFIDATFFTKVNKFILTIFFLGWNLSQISFGIFLSMFVKSSIYANLIGYLLSVLMTLAFSGISFTVFPNPSLMSYYFYVIPHSAYVRFFYSITYDCFHNKCYPDGVLSLEGDSKRSFWAIFVTFGGYAILSLVFSFIDLNKIWDFIKYNILRYSPEVDEEAQESLLSEFVGDSLIEGSLDNTSTKLLGEYRENVDRISARNKQFMILVRHLTKVYPNGKIALDDFSIAIKRNEIFALLGPNGAGKTTLLSILTGGLQRSSGKIFIDGVELAAGKRGRRTSDIGYCPQFDILWPNMTVKEHITFFTIFKNFSGADEEQHVASLIGLLGLSKHQDKQTSQLSGGMKRRVSLGNAITGDPKLIFLDEPTTGLDPVRRREFWDLIKSVGIGRAVVLTTHIMEEADVLSKEIGIMAKGELLCIGTSLSLKEKYSEGMKIQVVASDTSKMAYIKERIAAAFSPVKLGWEFDKTLTFNVPYNDEQLLRIFEFSTSLINEGAIVDWSFSNGSLEDVFHNVVSIKQISRRKSELIH